MPILGPWISAPKKFAGKHGFFSVHFCHEYLRKRKESLLFLCFYDLITCFFLKELSFGGGMSLELFFLPSVWTRFCPSEVCTCDWADDF